MIDPPAWTEPDGAADAALHAPDVSEAGFVARLTDVAASRPGDAGREDQPAFILAPGARR